MRIERFVILAHARSGSTLLMNALGQHPHVLACGELFNDVQTHRSEMPASFQLHNPGSPSRYQDNASGRDFLNHILYEAEHPEPIAAVGWKLLFDQALHPPAARTAWSFLQSRRDIRVIRLVRQNLLEAWVSLQIALQSGQWHVAADSVKNVITVPPLTVSIPEFEGYVRQIASLLEDSKKTFCHHSITELEYQSDLCCNFARTMERIHEFLGLQCHPTAPPLRKLAEQPLRSRVSNFEEVLLHFHGSPFQRYVAF
jgi:LPS sulfotransferase NodH